MFTCRLLEYYSNGLINDFSFIKWISSNVLLVLLFVNVLIFLNLYMQYIARLCSYNS